MKRTLILTSCLLISSLAFAGGEDEYALSVSGGIADPSYSTAVFQNPAGLAYNSSFKGTVQAAPEDPFTLRGGLLGGNGTFGAAAGIGHSFPSPATTQAFYGLGISAEALKFSLGAAGFTTFGTNGGSSSTSVNVGAMFRPDEKIGIGVTAIGVDSGVNEWGAGLMYHLDAVSGLVLDSSVDSKFKNFGFQPGLIVGNDQAALTVSYGFGSTSTEKGVTIGDGFRSAELSDGFAAGGSLKLGSSASFQLYYKQLAKLYAVLSFGF